MLLTHKTTVDCVSVTTLDDIGSNKMGSCMLEVLYLMRVLCLFANTVIIAVIYCTNYS